jgi:phosphoribosylformylglycinamidine synthase
MWQFAETVRGIADACAALGTPVTGGNVSFYNETAGRAIQPTPVIGMLGALPDATRAVATGFRAPGDAVVLLGRTDPADLGGSEYAWVARRALGGRPPPLDLTAEAALHDLLVGAAARGLLASAHDCSLGGLAVTLAESAIAGGLGVRIELGDGEPYRLLFSESPSRAVVSCAPARLAELVGLAEHHGVAATVLGEVGGDELALGPVTLALAEVAEVFEDALPNALAGAEAGGPGLNPPG